MILYYFPIAQNTVNKTVRDFFRGEYACICMRTYSFIISIYWSDTSLLKNIFLIFLFFKGCPLDGISDEELIAKYIYTLHVVE